MSILKCNPAVFVQNNDYVIGILTNDPGLIYININDEIYRPDESGVLSTLKNHALIKVPQKALDEALRYTVCYRSCPERKAYWTEMGEIQSFTYNFRSLKKKNDIHIYHCADIHGDFEKAKRCTEFFDKTDLLICNGDIVETNRIEDFYDSYRFLSDVTLGEFPILFVKGNHDNRGTYAELYNNYFPNENGKCYFGFSIGNIEGIALDCGEDKEDKSLEYGGVNDFSSYRKRETDFLENFKIQTDCKWRICVSHICPNATTLTKGNIFDIERDVYEKWTEILENLKIDCMFSGHIHSFSVLLPDDSKNMRLHNTLNHNYPVFTASMKNNHLGGAAIIINGDNMTVHYTDDEKNILATYGIRRNDLNSFETVKELTD